MHTHQRIDLNFLDEQPTPTRPWDGAEALRLMRQADELTIRLGVSSTHPALQAGAERAIAAYDRRDMDGLRAAVIEIESVARGLARTTNARTR